MNEATSSNVNATRRIWTQSVFTADRSGEDYIVILTRRSPKDDSMPDLSVRACSVNGPTVGGGMVYIPPKSLDEWGMDPFNTISQLLADEGIVMGACLAGLGKKGRQLYSWRAMSNVQYEDMKGSSGKRRAVMHLRHRYMDLEISFQGPWRVGNDDSVRKAMFLDWNTKMSGFEHIDWDVDEMEMLADLGFNIQ